MRLAYFVGLTFGIRWEGQEGHHLAEFLHVGLLPWRQVLFRIGDRVLRPSFPRQLNELLFSQTELQCALYFR